MNVVSRAARAAAVVLAVGVACCAAAEEDPYASPRWGSFDLSVSGYRPNIDSEFGGAAAPYQTAFGGGRSLMFRGDLAKSFFVPLGVVELGVGAGFSSKSGSGQLPGGGASGDSTSLKIIPTRLFVSYRLEYLVEHYPIPLAPYVRLSLDRYWWWVTNGSGDVARSGNQSGSGATNGYSLSAGVALQLDFFDRTLAREMDHDTGINHTYLFAEFTKSYIKDFGSSQSWDLSDDRVTISGGILFVF